jgi:pimeloyl-ACP methyl ester carboxylesterase
MSALKMPLLIITGDDDRIVPTQSTLDLAGELPAAKLVVIENCGHVPHEECPAEFVAAVMDFIK